MKVDHFLLPGPWTPVSQMVQVRKKNTFVDPNSRAEYQGRVRWAHRPKIEKRPTKPTHTMELFALIKSRTSK